MVIDTVELYILIIVYLTMNLIQGHRSARKPKTAVPVISQFLIDVDGIWCTVETCWCNKFHTHLITSILYSKESILLM